MTESRANRQTSTKAVAVSVHTRAIARAGAKGRGGLAGLVAVVASPHGEAIAGAVITGSMVRASTDFAANFLQVSP